VNLIVSTPEPMLRMRVLSARDLSGRVLTTLQRIGVLHLEPGTALGPSDRDSIQKQLAAVNLLLGDIERVLTYAPADALVRIGEDPEVFLTRPVGEIEDEARAVCARLTAMHQRADALVQERERWHELLRVSSLFSRRTDLTTRDLGFCGEKLYSHVAILPREGFDGVHTSLAQLTLSLEVIEDDEEIVAFFIGHRRMQAEVEELVSQRGRLVSLPGEERPLGRFEADARSELAHLAREQQFLRAEIESSTRDHLNHVVLLREGLLAERERLACLELACEADHVTLFEGWVPESQAEEASMRLREEIRIVHVDTSRPQALDEPPSKLRNGPALRPFEAIINLFATPRYREWDPTPIVACFFALFFGIMLGDALYGALLLLMARYLLPRLVDDPEADGFRMFRRLITICAGAAILVGVLNGSYLGDFPSHFFGAPNLAVSHTIHAAYTEPLVFIVVALFIGLVHVNLAHLLMLIRGVRERRLHAVISRSAIFLVQAASLPWVLRLLGIEWLALANSTYSLLLYLVLAGVFLIIVASVMEHGPFLGSILWVFDLSGILGDVMSYARLAGVGLATYFLAFSFNMMATLIAGMLPEGIIRAVLGSAVILVILVFGHVLNLLLSSITCFVHALRLCFVEFLFKFYEGGGRPYAPFRLRRRQWVPVRAGSRTGRA
jgi:V/A-type H+/Na+-transporting ATPase subunit I